MIRTSQNALQRGRRLCHEWIEGGRGMRRIYVVGTADTKGEELNGFSPARIREIEGEPLIVDIGIRRPTIEVGVSAAEVASFGAPGILEGSDRGAAVAGMADAFAKYVAGRDDIAGMIGIGGGGGTSIVTAGMRTLPIGLPKVMVSTLASGDVAPYVGVSDIVMMPSVTDLAGLNRISRTILSNAAQAIVAMSGSPPRMTGERPAVGLTMFGVTTPAVTEIVRQLRDETEPVVFHATGTGGRTMETLVDSGLLTGIIDITTTEVVRLPGGRRPAGRARPAGLHRAHQGALRGFGRGLRHGQLLGPRNGAGAFCGTAVLPAQRQRDADAHDAGGKPRRRRVDRRQAEPLRRAGALRHPGARRVGARHRGRRPSATR